MRRLALLAFATLLCSAPRAQGVPPVGSTVVSGGGPSSDAGVAVDVAVETGETVVVGTFERTATFGSLSITSADAPDGRSDAFVVKYDASGEALWARRMGTGVFNDFGAGVAIAPLFGNEDPGSVYVSGYFTGVATFDGGANPTLSLTTRNDFDAFLAKYSPSGDLMWVTQAGGPEQDTGRGVTVDLNGRACQAGSFGGTATWGAGDDAETRTSAGSSDGFLACYRPDGTLDRLLTVGGSDSDGLFDVDAGIGFGSGAGMAATGTFRGVARFGAFPVQSRGLADVFVIQVENGAVTSAQQVGGSGNDYARGVAVGLSGRVAVVGSFENDILVGTDVLTSAGFSDAFMAVYDPDGTPVGGARGGGAGFDIATGVAATPFPQFPTRGGPSAAPVFVSTGYVDGASTFGTVSVPAQGLDAFAAIYADAEDGAALLDVLQVGGPDADRGGDVAIGDFPQEIVLTGSYRSVVLFGNAVVSSAGSNDVFVARVPLCPAYSCLSVDAEDEPAAEAPRLVVAPNPSRAPAVTLRLGAPADVTVEIVDVLGRVQAVLHRGALAAGETRLGVPALAPGAYVVRVRGGAAVRRPFVVVR